MRIESAQTQVLADALLMFGDRLLPAGVGVDRLGVGSQLQGGEPQDLAVDLQGRLLGESAEHTHEGDLVREAQLIVGAPPQGDRDRGATFRGGGPGRRPRHPRSASSPRPGCLRERTRPAFGRRPVSRQLEVLPLEESVGIWRARTPVPWSGPRVARTSARTVGASRTASRFGSAASRRAAARGCATPRRGGHQAARKVVPVLPIPVSLPCRRPATAPRE